MHSILSVEHKIDKSFYDRDGGKEPNTPWHSVFYTFIVLLHFTENRKISKITAKEFQLF
jgi:hypothetical protein